MKFIKKVTVEGNEVKIQVYDNDEEKTLGVTITVKDVIDLYYKSRS